MGLSYKHMRRDFRNCNRYVILKSEGVYCDRNNEKYF